MYSIFSDNSKGLKIATTIFVCFCVRLEQTYFNSNFFFNKIQTKFEHVVHLHFQAQSRVKCHHLQQVCLLKNFNSQKLSADDIKVSWDGGR